MNNKMATNTYLSIIDLKNKANKKNRDRILYMESTLMVARCEGSVGEWVKRSGD